MLITVEHDKLFLHACSRVNGQTNILHRVTDTSTNRRQGFLCRRKVSMEQTADRAEVVAVDHYFSSLTENSSGPVCLRTPGNRLMMVRPRYNSSRERNVNNPDQSQLVTEPKIRENKEKS